MKRLLILSLFMFSGPMFVQAAGADGMAARAIEVAAEEMRLTREIEQLAQNKREVEKALKVLQEEECPVCMDKFEKFEDVWLLPKKGARCGHAFHPNCIVQAAIQKLECPTCREPIVKKEIVPLVIEKLWAELVAKNQELDEITAEKAEVTKEISALEGLLRSETFNERERPIAEENLRMRKEIDFQLLLQIQDARQDFIEIQARLDNPEDELDQHWSDSDESDDEFEEGLQEQLLVEDGNEIVHHDGDWYPLQPLAEE